MLLGFVNRAIRYLDRELDDKTNVKLNKLKDIDLADLKEELSEDLNASLGSMQSTINTLLQAGEEAFDDFLDEHLEESSLADELDRIFDKGSSTPKKSESDLEKLLDFYNLGDLNLDEEDFEEDFEEKVEEPVAEVKEEPKSEEEEEVFELSDEDTDLFKQIAKNVNRPKEETPDKKEEDEDLDVKKLDSIFSEVVSHEDEKEPEEEEKLPEQVDKDDIIKLVQDIQASKETYFANVPDPVYEDEPDEKELEEFNQSEKQEDVYVSSLIEDLRERMLYEDEKKKVEEEEFRQVYDRIHKIYPYLPNAFIRTVYDLKDSLAREYPINEKLIVLHRCIFKDVESLRQFVEIALSHNFSINADEEKLMVDVIKEYFNTDGKIITSIFEVANQSALLGGTYDGYRVMLEEKA